MPRIISGDLRGRRLAAPPDAATTRPYPDRVKESVCNLLRGWFEGAAVLDLFAGVGTISIEMASRGAATVVAVERDRRILGLLRRNITDLGVGDVVTSVAGDALAPATLARAPRRLDLVFIDPPYAMMKDDPDRERVLHQAARAGAKLAGSGFLVLRTPLDPGRVPHPVEGLDGPEVHAYARDMFVCLYAPPKATGNAGADEPDDEATAAEPATDG